MSYSGRPAAPDRNSPGNSPDPGEGNAGWSVFSYLISGMAVYGAIGWFIGRWTHLAFLFPVGMLTGLVLAIVLIIYRYGRPLITVRQAGAAARPGGSRAAAPAVRKVAAVRKVKACAAACHPTDIRVPCLMAGPRRREAGGDGIGR